MTSRKPALCFRVHALCYCLQSIQHDTGEGLADNAKEGYYAIVNAIAAIAFVFVERDDVGTLLSSQQHNKSS